MEAQAFGELPTSQVFALAVEDDGFAPHFARGDVLVVRKGLSPKAGDYVIAQRGGSLLCLICTGESPAKEALTPLGVVVGFYRPLRRP